jgi:hypothetical protein
MENELVEIQAASTIKVRPKLFVHCIQDFIRAHRVDEHSSDWDYIDVHARDTLLSTQVKKRNIRLDSPRPVGSNVNVRVQDL